MSEDRWISGDLPSLWAETTFSEFCDVVRGGSPRPMGDPRYFGGPIPFVKISDVTASDGRILLRTSASVTVEGSKRSRLLPKGTLILSNSGTICVPVFLGVDACIHDGFVTFDDLPEEISTAYLFHFFNYVRPFLRDKHKQGVTQVNLNTGIVGEISFPLPPLNEQKRIVAKIEELFSELDAGEESLRKARRQLGVYRQSLLKQAFEGKLTAPWREQNPQLIESPEQLLARIQAERQADYEKQLREFESALREWGKGKRTQKKVSKPSEPKLLESLTAKELAGLDLPVDWAVERIGSCPTDSLIGLVRAATEQSSDPAGTSYIKMDRIDMLGNVDLSAEVFVTCTEDETERFRLRKGDILFNTRNSVELVGKTAVLRREPMAPTVYNNNLMRIRLPDCLDPTFVGLQLCAKPFRQRMEQMKKATTSVAAIYGKDFWPLAIVVPSLPEQQEIVRLLDEQFTVIAQNEREIATALKRSEALRQSILKKAFSGQLVAQDPADEPAGELLERIRKEREGAVLGRKRPERPHGSGKSGGSVRLAGSVGSVKKSRK